MHQLAISNCVARVNPAHRSQGCFSRFACKDTLHRAPSSTDVQPKPDGPSRVDLAIAVVCLPSSRTEHSMCFRTELIVQIRIFPLPPTHSLQNDPAVTRAGSSSPERTNLRRCPSGRDFADLHENSRRVARTIGCDVLARRASLARGTCRQSRAFVKLRRSARGRREPADDDGGDGCAIASVGSRLRGEIEARIDSKRPLRSYMGGPMGGHFNPHVLAPR